ncbi:hypothetical protein JOD20_001799 [Herpetosiphon giganteus]|nr:hypothetical protein [Herpetosiphon giganteus]
MRRERIIVIKQALGFHFVVIVARPNLAYMVDNCLRNIQPINPILLILGDCLKLIKIHDVPHQAL